MKLFFIIILLICVIITDIDECVSRKGGCQTNCINAAGSYKCGCDNGYKLMPDGTSCEGKSFRLIIIIICYSIFKLLFTFICMHFPENM